MRVFRPTGRGHGNESPNRDLRRGRGSGNRLEAGIVLDELNPEELARALDLVVSDETTNVALGLRGWQRHEQNFTNQRIETLLLQALNGR